MPIVLSVSSRLVVGVKEGVIDVRPKLLQDIENAIQGDLCYPFLPGLCPCALSRRIVRARNAGARTIAHNLRKVKPRASGIGFRNDDAR